MDAPEAVTPRPAPALRRATAGDAEAVAELSDQLGYLMSAHLVRSRLAQLAVLPDHAIIVAELNGSICGWVHARVQQSLVSGERGEILGLVVARELRRAGIGRLLMSEAERWVRDRGLDEVVLRSNVKRSESHAFYPAIGYEHFRTQAVYRKRLR
jgi:GNAT superfamily N-acetyltransferase